jgi:RNA 2',3'-cyclic 3'-phosphodiesterase
MAESITSNPQETVRLFVAVSVPDAVKGAVTGAQAELRRLVPGQGISWTRPEQFHLTLKFLGPVNARNVNELITSLDGVGASYKPLQLRAAGAGFFPSATRPRVIWAGLDDLTGQLPELHAAVERAIGNFCDEKPADRFHAHVTLGRVKFLDRERIRSMDEWARSQAGKVNGEWRAGSIELVRSQLSPKGAVHTVLHHTHLLG